MSVSLEHREWVYANCVQVYSDCVYLPIYSPYIIRHARYDNMTIFCISESSEALSCWTNARSSRPQCCRSYPCLDNGFDGFPRIRIFLVERSKSFNGDDVHALLHLHLFQRRNLRYWPVYFGTSDNYTLSARTNTYFALERSCGTIKRVNYRYIEHFYFFSGMFELP